MKYLNLVTFLAKSSWCPDGDQGCSTKVDEWISQFEEGYWPPLTNLARLIEEVGELARELNHRFGSKVKKPEEPKKELALELADILFVLIVIANEQGIDLDEALQRVLAKYRKRDGERWAPTTLSKNQ
ncbi:MAG: nucleotide pyrophosphohydrolase [Methylococcales bacterium]|nr:nucleotide pyrophosphohydrolase [Methylococcales bacterium]